MRNCFITLGLFLVSALGCLGQNVYLAGSFMDGTGSQACYWHNEKLYPSHIPDLDAYYYVSVENNCACVTGIYYKSTNPYWPEHHDVHLYCGKFMNGRKIEEYIVLAARYHDTRYVNQTFRLHDAEYCNGKLYATGYITARSYGSDKWFMYVDDEMTSCSANTSITSYAGTIYKSDFHSISAYGQRVDLGSSARIQDIHVAYGIVYAVGSQNSVPCYWIDGMIKNLPLPKESNKASVESIAVLSNGNVYAIVESGNKSFFWGGTGYANIPNAESFTKVFVLDDMIYLLGRYKNGAFSRPCYWVLYEKDGSLRQSKMVTIPNARNVYDIVVTR